MNLGPDVVFTATYLVCRWLQSAKGTVLTMTCSFGGGSTGLILCYIFYGGHIIHVGKMVTTVLGSLVYL